MMLLPYMREPATGSRMPSRQSSSFQEGRTISSSSIEESDANAVLREKNVSHQLVSSGSAHA